MTASEMKEQLDSLPPNVRIVVQAGDSLLDIHSLLVDRRYAGKRVDQHENGEIVISIVPVAA